MGEQKDEQKNADWFKSWKNFANNKQIKNDEEKSEKIKKTETLDSILNKVDKQKENKKEKKKVVVIDDAMIKKAVNVIKRAQKIKTPKEEVQGFLKEKGFTSEDIKKAYDEYNKSVATSDDSKNDSK